MKTGLVQYSPSWEDKKSSKEKLSSLADQSGETDLLIFPEMSLTGFTMKSEIFFEDMNGESVQYFSSVAARKKTYVIAGIIEKDEDKYFNTAIVIDRAGEVISRYRKIHPFSYSSENLHYSGGTDPIIININGWRTGLSVCYDLRFPELYRFYGKGRTDLIINIANWPDTRIHHWNALLKARAIENQCYIAAVNRTGNDPKLKYPGSSSLLDPMGEELIKAGNEEKIFIAEIQIDKVSETRSKFPFLEDIKLV